MAALMMVYDAAVSASCLPPIGCMCSVSITNGTRKYLQPAITPAVHTLWIYTVQFI